LEETAINTLGKYDILMKNRSRFKWMGMDFNRQQILRTVMETGGFSSARLILKKI